MFEVYLRELRAVVDGTADLSKVDTERAGRVLATAIRMQLERQYPDGLDADDLRQIVAGCDGDRGVLLVVLAGALGVHTTADSPVDVITPAVSLLTSLVPPHRTQAALAAALEEIATAERMEIP